MILIRHGQTEFNRIFSVTRRDPGIRDPQLTETGQRQAAAVAAALRTLNLRRLISSPYIRALETAEIIAGHLQLPIAVEALVAERCVFACDVGSDLATLRGRWPDLTFDHLPDPWWPQQEETEEMLFQRSEAFCCRMTAETSSEVAVITHWGFIRAVTGLKVPNGTVLRIDPAQSDRGVQQISLPDPC
jgi:broad specificity phosphatase PhoE